MKLIKKILLVLGVILVIAQIPFIYLRYTAGQRVEKIARIQSERVERPDPNFTEYKGIIHVHTPLGGHSTGGFNELIDAANANGLDFVLMTEHYSEKYDTSALTLNGIYGRTLFIGGNEIDSSDSGRFLMVPGSADAAGFRLLPANAVLQKIHSGKGLAFVTYPEKFKPWDSDFDGIEVFSLNTEARKINPFLAALDMLWSGTAYPALTLTGYFSRPDTNLQQFDQISTKRRVTLFTGLDAHSNIGVHFFGDEAGHRFLNIKLDPYADIFSIARIHLLIEKGQPMGRENLVNTLRSGHFFTGFDVLGDSTGFSFTAAGDATIAHVGDETPYSEKLMIRVASPVKARFVVIKNGEKFAEAADTLEYTFKPDGPGVYRVEAYQDALGASFDRMPWVLTNPIYVR